LRAAGVLNDVCGAFQQLALALAASPSLKNYPVSFLYQLVALGRDVAHEAIESDSFRAFVENELQPLDLGVLLSSHQ
jgi:hypothetical protein